MHIIDEEKFGADCRWGASKRFWEALSRKDDDNYQVAGPPEEDELFEAAMVDTNMVWQLEGNELLPLDKYWASLPRVEMLQNDQVLVFDFGSEMYVWTGKQAPFEARKRALHLAKELWQEGYNYSECDMNPIFPQKSWSAKTGKPRPAWTLFGKANQHMEPVLFREKFPDWPDSSRLIQVKKIEMEEKTASEVSKLQAFDAHLMISNRLEDPDLQLEGAHLGRGGEFYNTEERRLLQVTFR